MTTEKVRKKPKDYVTKFDYNATITLNYNEYIELIENYEVLRKLLCEAKNTDDFDKELKARIEQNNNLYGWWA